MVLEEIETLTNRLKKQTVNGRQESNEMNVKLNGLTKKIKEVTRSMMAKVSELSMHQALAMNLFQEHTEKQTLVESINERLMYGDIPTELIERDLVRAEKMRIWQQNQLHDEKHKGTKQGHDNFVQM